MPLLQLIAFLAPLLAPGPALALQETEPSEAPSTEAAPPNGPEAPADETTSRFGEPLFVDGERISDLEIQRYLIYGIGQGMLEARKYGILVEQEMELRRARLTEEVAAEMFPQVSPSDADVEPASSQLSEDQRREVEAEVEQRLALYRLDPAFFEWVKSAEIERFKRRYPGLDLDTEMRRAYAHPTWYDAQLRATLEFDQCFFPGHPDQWPDVTKEAVYQVSPDFNAVEDMRESWERRKQNALEAGSEFVEREDEMFMGLLREYVLNALLGIMDVQTATDGLPPELAMVLDAGWRKDVVTTEEMWSVVEPAITDHDVSAAKRYLALMKATENRLAEEGALISMEAHRERVGNMQLELADSMFDLDFLATQAHQFPSSELFQQHIRAMESFRDMVAPEIAPQPDGSLSPVLEEYLPLANQTMGLARVDAEVILVSAFDYPNYRWKENGWEWALEHAQALRAEIDAHLEKLRSIDEARREAAEQAVNFELEGEPPMPFDRFWAQLLDLHSEFWDPPMPAEGKMPPDEGFLHKGRFGSLTRNDFDRMIGESSFTKFLTGRSTADLVLLDLEPGDVAGPLRGPNGYFLVYLKSRTPPSNPLNMREERHVDLLREEYVRNRFVEYAHRALEEAEVEGLEPL